MTFGSHGSDDGQFDSPTELKIDKKDNIYVVDTGNHRIPVFDLNGDFITKFGVYGSNPGEFINPIALDIDSKGNIYVTDERNFRVQVFSPVS